jgi:uncharacterized protein (TIGR00266 family)
MDAQVHGSTMPILEVRLDPGESVVAESGELGWITDGIELETASGFGDNGGVWEATKRSLGGGTFFMTRYSATTQPGTVTFPAKLPGTIFRVPLGPGREYLVHRHGFLAGTSGCLLSLAANVQLGAFGSGFLLQRLAGTGHAWIELCGELTQLELAAGESVRVHPGHVGLFDATVTQELTTVPGIKNKLFGGDGIFLVRLTGPGKVVLQSMSLQTLGRSLAPYVAANGAPPSGNAAAVGAGAAVAGAAVEAIADLF